MIDWADVFRDHINASGQFVTQRILKRYHKQLMEGLGRHYHDIIDLHTGYQIIERNKPDPLCDCEERKVLEKYCHTIAHWVTWKSVGGPACAYCPACKRRLP